MISPRPAVLALPALALAACAPSDKGEDDGKDSPSFGYELAVAKASSGEEAVEVAPLVIDLSAEQLRDKLAAGNIRLIDVRRPDEYAERHIAGAELIPLDQFDPATLGDDDREIVLYCRSGRRSGIAGEALAAHTGKPAQHLAGGINAWEEAGEQVISS